MDASTLNHILSGYGHSIGLGPDCNTWEWFDRKNEEYGEGFSSAMEAYQDALTRIDAELPRFNDPEEGFFIDTSGNIRRTDDPEDGTFVETHEDASGNVTVWVLDEEATLILQAKFHSTIEGVTHEILERFGHASGTQKHDIPTL